MTTNLELYNELKSIESSLDRLNAAIDASLEASEPAAAREPLHYATGCLLEDKQRILAAIGPMLYRAQYDDGTQKYFWYLWEALNSADKLQVWRGEMYVCVKHPSLTIVYSEEYKTWFANQQTALRKVSR